MQILSGFLLLLAGLGVFLLGMRLISDHLKNLAGGKVNDMMGKISNNSLAGIGLGVGASMILESSSATTVILISLVEAGIVNLIQATLIIMGANIGTTLTVVLFSLNYLPVGEIISFLSLVGIVIVMGGKKEKTKEIGWIVASVGLIFVGLQVMSGGVDKIKETSAIVDALSSLKNPFLLVAFGLIFTAIVQSGSATTGIVITLCSAGIMPTVSAFYIIIGSNVGSCMTAIIASVGSSLNAKRTAFIHLAFNTLGAIIFMPIIIAFGEKTCRFLMGKFSPAVIIAYFHVVFNTITTVILLPFVKKIVSLAEAVLPDKKPKKVDKNVKPKFVSKIVNNR